MGLGLLLLLPALAAAAPVLQRNGPLRSETVVVPKLNTGVAYSFLFSVDSPRAFGADSRVEVRLAQGGETLVEKTLHIGDPDLYATFRVLNTGAAEARIETTAVQGAYHLQITRLPASMAVETEPNNRWQQANPIALGSLIEASADDAPYIPLPGTRPKDILESGIGVDWFRFTFHGRAPKLVFFQLELMERDNIPVDVSVYRVVDGKAVAFNDGEDPVTLPHEVQALPGNKFTTRVLKDKGEYYIRVEARHPEYKLRTRVYNPPPYDDPRKAVRTGVDFIPGAGDSWHANTPRRGGVYDRVANVHQETSLCVACHPTHFSQRAALYALKNGYPVVQRNQLDFLAERFYNNPRPFYGFEAEGAVWARVISAPANVLSRMSVLLDIYESGVAGVRRERFHHGVREYLKLYYKGRDKLPPGETNGNTPLISAYEVAWYSWRVTRDEKIAALIEQEDIKNAVDLCYQTLALADIDRTRHAAKIRRNAERILALQRPNGQWSMRFEPGQPEAEFQTGHALWALHAAGIPAENPQVAKAIRYLLNRQQPFGGWMDPLQSFENFRTPFRETQMAILALSAYFPGPGSGKPDGGLARPQARALGAPSKLAQRAAARDLRLHYSRSETASLDPLLAALDSPDDRTRWGATRVFAQHASALARYPELAAALARRVDDPVVTVRMQALKGLWQYWFWTPDELSREIIEDTFLQAMAQPQHVWVERTLREGIYNIADENIRYFYNNWIPLLANAEDRARVIQGRLAVEARLAHKFATVLETGSDLQRKRLLAGLADFHLRRGDVYDLNADPTSIAPLVYSRIGNDVEQSVFFGPSNERLARALLPLLDSKDTEIARLAMRAAPLVRTMKFPGVNELAGPSGESSEKIVQALLKRQPESAEILKAFGRAPAAANPQPEATRARTKYVRPDEARFRGYVQPILETRGKDGFACVHCHASHTIFNGTWSTVTNVVDLNDPENSLLLRKPTSSAESEGTLGSGKLPHGGGIRWEKNSPEYQTILNWIKGAK